jgi:uncharacterized membrane protein (DUF2068 family)
MADLRRPSWELLVCGLVGHRLIGVDAAELRPSDALVARSVDGVRWHRCVRCDSWLPQPAPSVAARRYPPARDEIELPLRGRPLRDKLVLRLIALERAFHFVVLGLIGTAILVFSADRARFQDDFYTLLADLQGGPIAGGDQGRRGLIEALDRAFTLHSSRLHLFAAVILVYAAVEGIEAVGLWFQRRWAEYLTFAVTASFLPLEIYELAHRLTPLKLVAFMINVAVVIYLLVVKRLFGLRGGARADQAIRAADVGWPALERSAPEAANRRSM